MHNLSKHDLYLPEPTCLLKTPTHQPDTSIASALRQDSLLFSVLALIRTPNGGGEGHNSWPDRMA